MRGCERAADAAFWSRHADVDSVLRARVERRSAGILDRRPERLLLTHGGPYEPAALEI